VDCSGHRRVALGIALLGALGCVSCSDSGVGAGSADGNPQATGGATATGGSGTAASGGTGASGTGGANAGGAPVSTSTGGATSSTGGTSAGTGGAVSATGGAAGSGVPDGGAGDAGGAVGTYDPTNPPAPLTLTGDLGVHDPSLIASNGAYTLFYTGAGIPTKRSTDLHAWRETARVFSKNPSWIQTKVPGATDLWAPDISRFGGVFHLYYSASTFGKNRSCIGHATTASLDTAFTDHGPVVCSNDGTTQDDFNAIDPNVVLDEKGTPWLAFGSFWSGLKLVQLDTAGNRVGTTMASLAARPGNTAIEASFIVHRGDFYYLFASFDACCRGVDSTYNVRVGRSAAVSGPYVDRVGTPMTSGGGTSLLTSGPRYKGPGHNAVLFDGNAAYIVYHAYDANQNGASVLRVGGLAWDDSGWPVAGGP
jgi:arabinan endo-1,5-alpha-L-arabinosidase